MIAALYVEKDGTYANLPGVDLWDIERDARKYNGDYPVVAHPPCQRWSVMAYVTEKMYGYRVGDDGGCFAAALAAVRRCGGAAVSWSIQRVLPLGKLSDWRNLRAVAGNSFLTAHG